MLPPNTPKKESNDHYWSEYRRNYETAMKAKMEEDRLKIQTTATPTNQIS